MPYIQRTKCQHADCDCLAVLHTESGVATFSTKTEAEQFAEEYVPDDETFVTYQKEGNHLPTRKTK